MSGGDYSSSGCDPVLRQAWTGLLGCRIHQPSPTGEEKRKSVAPKQESENG